MLPSVLLTPSPNFGQQYCGRALDAIFNVLSTPFRADAGVAEISEKGAVSEVIRMLCFDRLTMGV
jgi:hypothetical protein